jgi:hypothetical protein
VEILQPWVEICLYNTSTKRSSNLAPFDKISKSGDGEGSGDISVLLCSLKVYKINKKTVTYKKLMPLVFSIEFSLKSNRWKQGGSRDILL